MKIKPATEHILLGILMSGPKHGYEIMRFLDVELGATWHVGASQLYALLKRLEREGLITSSLEKQNSRPSKRMVSLTRNGKALFVKWLHKPTAHVRDLRMEFLAKLFFFHHLDLKGGDDLIDAQIRILEHTRERLLEKSKREKESYQRLVIECKMISLESWLNWLKNKAKPFISDLEKMSDHD